MAYRNAAQYQAAGNMHGKLGDVWRVVFEICVRTDRQTDMQTRY